MFVDTGLMRAGETEQVREAFGTDGLVLVDAADRFLAALAGVTDPEAKRRIIGELFVRIFEAEARGLGDVAFLVQGTLYPDVIESGGDVAARIKSHHNVGGLPDDMQLELVEPLRDLFKDEVRLVGERLGLPPEVVWRHPFPGPGLGVRIIGEVTPEKVETVRAADAIVRAEIRRGGLDREVWQVLAVLLDVRSVGVMGGRAHLRPSGRDPGRDQRRRHDRGLRPPALRRARGHGRPDRRRGARRQQGRLRHHVQTPRHHRVGVTPPGTHSSPAGRTRTARFTENSSSRRWRSTFVTSASTLSPGTTTSLGWRMGCSDSSAVGTRPLIPSPTVTNAPNGASEVTVA